MVIQLANNYARTIAAQQSFSVNPGELNRRIAIVSNSKDFDEDGYQIEREETVYSCWAKFTRVSGSEKIKANSDFSQVSARFLIRYTTKPLSRKMVVRYDGNDYEIEYLNDYGDSHRYIEVWCKLMTREG